jgi:replicative DNA helicase
MTNYEVGRRILANSEKKNIMDLRKGIFDNDEFSKMEKISNLVGDSWEFNIKKVANILDVQKYIRKYKPEIVFIDYLQNLGVNNDYSEITSNMRAIQSTALKEEITIFILSQLSREKKEIRRPRLNDLRGSGRIEELSNIVLLLYWENRLKENVTERKGGEDPEQLEVSISKNRAGTMGRVMLDFYPEYCRIESPENNDYEGGH